MFLDKKFLCSPSFTLEIKIRSDFSSSNALRIADNYDNGLSSNLSLMTHKYYFKARMCIYIDLMTPMKKKDVQKPLNIQYSYSKYNISCQELFGFA